MAPQVVIEDLTVLFSFRGRIRRGTFWDGWAACTLLCLFFGAVLLGLWIATAPPATSSEPAASAALVIPEQLWVVGGLLACLPLWVWLAVCAKRWHDLGLPSAMLCLNILPVAALAFIKTHPLPAAAAAGLVDAAVILYLGLARGRGEPNKFGEKAI